MIPPIVGATYRHFKGAEYIVRELSHHHATRELIVVYRNVLSGTVHHRELPLWLEMVPNPKTTPSDMIPRFKLIKDANGTPV